MRGSQRRRTLWTESLETRRLLAADLQVEIQAPLHLIPGEETRFEVSVTNHGPDYAVGVELRSAGVDQALTDIQWERETALKRVWHSDQLVGQAALPIESPRNLGTSTAGIPIGDVNGDGWEDVLIANMETYPNEGAGQAWVLYGGAELPDEIDVDKFGGERGFRIVNLLAAPASAAGGGDVNGDGIADFVLGVPNTPETENAEQRAGVSYVIFGRRGGFGRFLDVTTLDGENGFRAYGRNTLDGYNQVVVARAGAAVDNRGDLNGDGFDDVVIAQPGGLWFREGAAVNVIYGGSGAFPPKMYLDQLDGNNGYSVQEEDEFVGLSVATSGDFNDDGIDDLLFASYSQRSQAYATVLWGSTEARPATLQLSELSPLSYSRFQVGTSTYGQQYSPLDNRDIVQVIAVDDFNGDQISDYVLATPLSTELGFMRKGQVNIVFGNRDGLPTKLTPESLNGDNGTTLMVNRTDVTHGVQLGVHLQRFGDVNGDGLSDVMLGSRRSGNWILYGSTKWPARTDLEALPPQAASELRNWGKPRSVGDVDRDGRSDLFVPGDGSGKIVLSPFHEQFEELQRHHPARVQGSGQFADNIDLPAGTTATYWVTGAARESAAGLAEWIVSANYPPGSVDNEPGTNVAQVVVPVRRNVDLQLNASNVYQLAGGDEVAFDLQLKNHGPQRATDAQLVTDNWIGLENVHWTRTTTQVAPGYVAGTPESEGLVTDRFGIPDQLGSDIVSVGDVNGDGLADLAAVGKAEHGVFIYLGQQERAADYPQLDGTQAVFFAADAALDGVAMAGDVNGDGLSDLLAWRQEDRVGYVIYGTRDYAEPIMSLSKLSVEQGFYLRSDKHIPRFAPVGVGDVNHDGFDDLAIRVRRHAGDYTGNLVIFAGGPTAEQGCMSHDIGLADPLGTIEVTKERWYVRETSRAGDFNGDGIDDLLMSIGDGDYSSGRLLVLYGDRDGLPHVTIDGEPLPPEQGFLAEKFGVGKLDVSPAGDINGDGLADVMAGYDGNVPSELATGDWGLVLGSRTGFDPDEHVISFSQSDLRHMVAVTAVGDVNFDGLDDAAQYGQRFADRFVLFGDYDIRKLHSRATLQSLTPEQGRFVTTLKAIGDFNGDGIHDYMVGDKIVITPTISTVAVGQGAPDLRLNLDPYSQVLWELRTRVRQDSPSELPTVTATVHAGAARSDTNLADNAVQILYVEAGHGEATRFDLNDDQIIDAADLAILARYYGTAVSEPGRGDFDEDGRVDFGDFLLCWQRFATS